MCLVVLQKPLNGNVKKNVIDYVLSIPFHFFRLSTYVSSTYRPLFPWLVVH